MAFARPLLALGMEREHLLGTLSQVRGMTVVEIAEALARAAGLLEMQRVNAGARKLRGTVSTDPGFSSYGDVAADSCCQS